MSLNLMTGYAGEPHITSADDGAVNAAIYGASKYVLNAGQKFAYELISNNLIKIKDGYAMNQGRKIGQAVNDYEELTIDNGLQGVKRSDIIAIRYSKNSDTGIESAEFIVIKGTSGDDYKDPACQTGNIIQGDLIDDFPLYRIKIDGINITAVEPMFDVLMSMEEIQRKYDDILGIQDISEIGDGTVTGAIDSLNSNFVDEEIYKMEHSSFSTPITFVRKGRTVMMTETNNIKSLVANQYINIGTLPSNFCPRAYVYCFGGPTAHTGMNIQIEITNTGIVRIYNYGNAISSTGIPCRFSLTYLTA